MSPIDRTIGRLAWSKTAMCVGVDVDATSLEGEVDTSQANGGCCAAWSSIRSSTSGPFPFHSPSSRHPHHQCDLFARDITVYSMAVSFFVQSLALILLFAALPYGTCTGTQHPLMADRQRPNIVFILTDDQDLHMDSLSYMPQLKKHLIDRGTSFARHYCTVALCCPSRVSLWTGKAARECGKRHEKFLRATTNVAL